jgi:hypothetical protein
MIGPRKLIRVFSTLFVIFIVQVPESSYTIKHCKKSLELVQIYVPQGFHHLFEIFLVGLYGGGEGTGTLIMLLSIFGLFLDSKRDVLLKFSFSDRT